MDFALHAWRYAFSLVRACLLRSLQSIWSETMTREDIIRLAREASSESDYDFPNIFALERFAALVAAAEREACAEVCDRITWSNEGKFFAAAIRARGDV
jgi:hypothetical protein